jgi:hypothetical protein
LFVGDRHQLLESDLQLAPIDPLALRAETAAQQTRTAIFDSALLAQRALERLSQLIGLRTQRCVLDLQIGLRFSRRKRLRHQARAADAKTAGLFAALSD